MNSLNAHAFSNTNVHVGWLELLVFIGSAASPWPLVHIHARVLHVVKLEYSAMAPLPQVQSCSPAMRPGLGWLPHPHTFRGRIARLTTILDPTHVDRCLTVVRCSQEGSDYGTQHPDGAATAVRLADWLAALLDELAAPPAAAAGAGEVPGSESVNASAAAAGPVAVAAAAREAGAVQAALRRVGRLDFEVRIRRTICRTLQCLYRYLGPLVTTSVARKP